MFSNVLQSACGCGIFDTTNDLCTCKSFKKYNLVPPHPTPSPHTHTQTFLLDMLFVTAFTVQQIITGKKKTRLLSKVTPLKAGLI